MVYWVKVDLLFTWFSSYFLVFRINVYSFSFSVVHIPGLTWNNEDQIMEYETNKFSVCDVFCIAACETEKVIRSTTIPEAVEEAKVFSKSVATDMQQKIAKIL